MNDQSNTHSVYWNIAGRLYSAYSESVGGVNFRGEPLPTWEAFAADDAKAKQRDGWLAAAAAGIKECTEILTSEGWVAASDLLKEPALPKSSGAPTVRAKFKVDSISPVDSQQPECGASVNLSPVYCGSKENEEFYKWTPGGLIQLSTINAAAANFFEPGKEYYVDFTPAN